MKKEDAGKMDVFPASDASEHDSSSSSCEESGYGADEQGDAGLTVVGYACRVFRDDATAQWIDSNEHLVRWGNELVDRFDVRCLLDPDAVFARREDAEACEEGLSPKQRERLQRERYKDLLRIEQRSAQAEAKRKEEARGVGFAVADSESKAQDAQQDAAKATNNSKQTEMVAFFDVIARVCGERDGNATCNAVQCLLRRCLRIAKAYRSDWMFCWQPRSQG